MINFTYDAIISQAVSPIILIHSVIGLVILVLGFVVMINRRSWKIKRRWKTKVNMRVLLVLWLVNFTLGTYMALFT
jgi:nitrate reductase gamma subunit